jgi:hypothetical protein
VVSMFKGFKPFRKNPRNSQKISLDEMFMNVNLDDTTTCMEEFGVPLQVEFGRIWSKFGRKFEFEKLIPNLVI